MLRPLMEKNGRVRGIVVGWLDHPAVRVRDEAMRALGVRDTAERVDGFYEKMLQMLDGDPNLDVRGLACSYLYATGNDAALAVIEGRLSDPKTTDSVLQGCFTGLISGWLAAHKPSKAAYELTLKLLERPGRDERMPPDRGL